jgi:8-oxo-dGTP pyrophosphatase MutT (NUDIX family)
VVDEPVVVRDINQEFGGNRFRLVTRLDRRPPPAGNTSTAHCLAFDGEHVVLALHATRDWTIPGGHLESGESPEEAMHREALEEAGIVVTDPILFAHEQIDPYDGIAADPRYPMPAFQVFYVARLVSHGRITHTEECTESRRFPPDEARAADGWVQRNRPLYEAALELARTEFRTNS